MNVGKKQSYNSAILSPYGRSSEGRQSCNRRAIAALPVMLLIAGIIAEMAAAGALTAYFLIQSGIGVKLSSEALAAANAGTEDGLMRLIRNKDLIDSYALTIGDKEIYVIISDIGGGKKKIISEGRAFLKRRKLEVIINIDSSTGEVEVESIQEVAL